MRIIDMPLFENTQETSRVPENEDIAIFRYLDFFSSIVNESFYVIDIPKNKICYISLDNLFLCNHSVEDVNKYGYDYYAKIVFPEDLILWKNILKTVLQYIMDFKGKHDEINYFSCTFRLQRKFTFLNRPLQQMVYHQMIPVWKNRDLHYLICSVRASSQKKAGNLRMYYKDGFTFEEYNFITHRWKEKKVTVLTELEMAIIMLAQQGKSSGDIAKDLYKGCNTIRNQIKALFSKLNVHTMQETLEFAGLTHMINQNRNRQLHLIEKTNKKRWRLLTQEMKQSIQMHLNSGLSIRQTAKQEDVAESNIRYWIKKGKLKCQPAKNH